MRVVLDTNVFISSFFGGKPKQIIDLWAAGEVTLCLCPAIIEEYLAVVRRLGLDGRPELAELLALLKRGHSISFASETPDLRAVAADPDDDKFIACAVALDAEAIVSGDHPLLDLKAYFDIPVLSPAALLARITEDR